MKSALLIISAAALLIAAENRIGQPTGLTVHEWGTFTTVAGEDGTPIEWDTLGCKNDLPTFVHDYGYRNFKWRVPATVRMETPVLYFYTARELEAHVKVGFSQGLITEWYPQAINPVDQRSAISDAMRRLDGNLNGVDPSLRSLTGGIEWKNVKVQPGTDPVLPLERGANHYYAARGTDAAPLTVGNQHEKFLFYRGVGRFPIPLAARVAEGKISVENRGNAVVPSLILFENRGGRIGYRNAGAMSGGVTLERPALDASFPQLQSDLEAALVAQGLFPKEAHAMVETWRDSWFEEGSRLIYILPASAVDAILPLQVEPAPLQTSRVFVGRMELVTPETKRAVQEGIARNDRTIADRYGRFLEPILARIATKNTEQALDIFRQNVQQSRCR